MFVWKTNGVLDYTSHQNCQSRNEATFETIRRANPRDFERVQINTGDVDNDPGALAFSTQTDDYSRCVPDFVFGGWPESGVDDYTETAQRMSEAGESEPEMNVMGWRGAMTHSNRRNLLKFTDKSLYDIEEVHWSGPSSTQKRHECTNNFVTLVGHVKKWKYLIDVEGNGWSARMKLLMFGRRVLFLQDRPHKEWFWPLMEPWKHFVPVARDLSDLEEKYKIVRGDPDIYTRVASESHAFAMKHLTVEAACERWRNVLN